MAVLAYNQERYVRDAVMGAFSQNYENLEIILSDDSSTDATYTILKDCVDQYAGKHKVILNRTEKNLGLVSHLNELVPKAFGEVIVVAAGDDISLPERVSE